MIELNLFEIELIKEIITAELIAIERAPADESLQWVSRRESLEDLEDKLLEAKTLMSFKQSKMRDL